MTYTLIAHTELASAQAEIVFSSIPATFTDLLVVASLRTSTVNADIGIKLNNSTSNFSNRYLIGNGSSASSGSAIGNFLGTTSRSDMTASTFGNVQVYIPNYRLAAAKSLSSDSVSENNGTFANQVISAILWNDTSAITSLSLYSVFGGDLVQFSSATLYGITSGSSGGVVVS